jgi:16S rRNA (cytosine1402-N4)-methyltransferase
MVTTGGHIPVLLEEVLTGLRAAEGPKRILDATFGGGGHTRALLNAHPENTVWALDVDPEAVARAAELKASEPVRFQFSQGNFEDLSELTEGAFDAMLFDFGLSSYHFDTPERGFAFRHDGPLDMRLDPGSGRSAADFLETASSEELMKALRNYGEEKQWRRIHHAILQARGTGVLQRTLSFAKLIEDTLGPAARRRSKIHPATRSFQGIRIAINRELEVIENALAPAFERLQLGGVLALISFHSLEDRIAKRFCRRMAGRPEGTRDNRPADLRPVFAKELTRRPLAPSEAECERNPRARSAKLRLLQKTANSL